MNSHRRSASSTTASLGLRAGEWVKVRSKDEILTTLDKRGRLDNMPFMPQMFAYCGQRLQVGKSAHKTCDTISGTGGRRVVATVHLEGVRCDGEAYGGCNAACLIFWKEAWLKRADGPSESLRTTAPGPTVAAEGTCTEADVLAGTRAPGPADASGPTYVCQATELVRATDPLAWWDVRQYLEDYRSGNVDVRQLAEGFGYVVAHAVVTAARRRSWRLGQLLITAYDGIQKVRGGVPFPRRGGTIPAGQKTPHVSLNLQPGELVRVKKVEEILATLDSDSKNRGLYFDAELVPFCGGTYRVRAKVNRIVDEKTGKMLEFKNGPVILEGVACLACYSDRRMFCPRAIYSYWREGWLERVDPVAG